MERTFKTIPENKFTFHGFGVDITSYSLGSSENQIIAKLQEMHFKYKDKDRLKVNDEIRYNMQRVTVRKSVYLN